MANALVTVEQSDETHCRSSRSSPYHYHLDTSIATGSNILSTVPAYHDRGFHVAKDEQGDYHDAN